MAAFLESFFGVRISFKCFNFSALKQSFIIDDFLEWLYSVQDQIFCFLKGDFD